jgi:hypothetical protein
MPEPITYNQEVPGWPGRVWRDLVVPEDCGIRPSREAEIFQAPGWKQPKLQAGIVTASQWCEEWKQWSTSTPAAVEKLGAQFEVPEAAAAQVLACGSSKWADGVAGYSRPLTEGEHNLLCTLWNWPDGTPIPDPILGAFVEVWNKLYPAGHEWFCTYRPRIPIEAWGWYQKARKTAPTLGGPGRVTGGGRSAAKKQQLSPTRWMIRPACAASDPDTIRSEILSGTRRELKDRQEAGERMAAEIRETLEGQSGTLPEEPPEEPPEGSPARSPLPLLLGGLGFLVGGPVGAAGGYVAGVAISKKGTQ